MKRTAIALAALAALGPAVPLRAADGARCREILAGGLASTYAAEKAADTGKAKAPSSTIEAYLEGTKASDNSMGEGDFLIKYGFDNPLCSATVWRFVADTLKIEKPAWNALTLEEQIKLLQQLDAWYGELDKGAKAVEKAAEDVYKVAKDIGVLSGESKIAEKEDVAIVLRPDPKPEINETRKLFKSIIVVDVGGSAKAKPGETESPDEHIRYYQEQKKAIESILKAKSQREKQGGAAKDEPLKPGELVIAYIKTVDALRKAVLGLSDKLGAANIAENKLDRNAHPPEAWWEHDGLKTELKTIEAIEGQFNHIRTKLSSAQAWDAAAGAGDDVLSTVDLFVRNQAGVHSKQVWEILAALDQEAWKKEGGKSAATQEAALKILGDKKLGSDVQGRVRKALGLVKFDENQAEDQEAATNVSGVDAALKDGKIETKDGKKKFVVKVGEREYSAEVGDGSDQAVNAAAREVARQLALGEPGLAKYEAAKGAVAEFLREDKEKKSREALDAEQERLAGGGKTSGKKDPGDCRSFGDVFRFEKARKEAHDIQDINDKGLADDNARTGVETKKEECYKDSETKREARNKEIDAMTMDSESNPDAWARHTDGLKRTAEEQHQERLLICDQDANRRYGDLGTVEEAEKKLAEEAYKKHLQKFEEFAGEVYDALEELRKEYKGGGKAGLATETEYAEADLLRVRADLGNKNPIDHYFDAYWSKKADAGKKNVKGCAVTDLEFEMRSLEQVLADGRDKFADLPKAQTEATAANVKKCLVRHPEDDSLKDKSLHDALVALIQARKGRSREVGKEEPKKEEKVQERAEEPAGESERLKEIKKAREELEKKREGYKKR